jgi:hypothetical protein
MLNVPEKAQNRFCRDIAPVEWMLQRHATHDKLISPMATPLRAYGSYEGQARRCDITAMQIFSFFKFGKRDYPED